MILLCLVQMIYVQIVKERKNKKIFKMKTLKQLLLIILISQTCISQNLKITDLTTLCNKKNWEGVNQNLIAKGWNFYESKKGDSFEYNSITWSFKKDNYNDKAQGWLHLYTIENIPNKIVYSFFNKASYLVFKNSIAPAGFKLVDNTIEDNEIVSTYSSSSFDLNVTTKKITDDDLLNSSKTGYLIIISKKQSPYKPEKSNLYKEYTITNKHYLSFAEWHYKLKYDVEIDGKKYIYGDVIKLKIGKHTLKETVISLEDGKIESSEQIEIELTEEVRDVIVEFNIWGACPFFYYQTESADIYGGELIRNQNSIEKDKIDHLRIEEKYISDNVLKLTISEEKEEESFLDNIYLKINDEVIIKVDSKDKNTYEKLANIDNNYLLIKQNEKVEVYFKIPMDIIINDLKLYSKGYYLTIKY
jgi:hypothetical protein